MMDELAITHEVSIRLSFFFGMFALVALAEILSPRRALSIRKSTRWVANLGLVGLNTVILRLALPAAAVAMAMFARERGFGLLNHVVIPSWMAFVVAVIILDLAMYLQHVVVHAVPLLWRLHRVHHADLDMDVTTGARFHPIEVVLSMLIKIAVVASVGAPPGAVVVFEVLLNATAMFNHGNVNIGPALDRIVRLVVVTPDMHRIHHSVEPDETNTNFGFNLPWWDRLFGTYRAAPRGGHEHMTVGIASYREPEQCDRLWGMLTMPFRGALDARPTRRTA